MVRKATGDDSARIVTSLVRAFENDPLLTWMVRRDAGRAQAMRTFFEMSLHPLTMPFGEVYTTAACEGAALWTPPGAWSVNILQHLSVVPRFVSATGIRRALTVFAGVQTIDARHPKERHFYLQTLGVDPSHQGRGLAKALVAPVLARCDADGVGAYLETAREINVKIYESLGFRVTERFTIPNEGPPMWSMWRAPRAALS